MVGALCYHAGGLWSAVELIVTYAFTPGAVRGGVMGVTMQQAIRFGMARSLNATEVGLGTAGILSRARFHNACHQSRGQRSIGREAEGPLPSLERLQFGGKLATDLGTRYEEAAMILKRA